MPIFQKPFFTSSNEITEKHYAKGVVLLSGQLYEQANQHFRAAAEGGHVSALYNLAILNGSGLIEPFDIDFAADCFYKAAQAGHPKAQEVLFMLEAADRAGMGTTHLANLALNTPPVDRSLPYWVMITGCRFYAAVCQATDAIDAVIHFELDAASGSSHQYVQHFVKRCGVSASEFAGGLYRLQEGDAASQITDGLNNLFLSMRQAGYADNVCLMARCTIVGYVIARSKYAAFTPPLPGINGFFNPLYDAPLLISRQD